MDIDFSDGLEIMQSAIEEQLYGALLQQLNKDFNLSNVAINFRVTAAPKEVMALLHEKIYYLMLEKFTAYLNVLYIVDVPEKAFKAIGSNDVVEVAKQVSCLILKREFQKVRWRNRYAS